MHDLGQDYIKDSAIFSDRGFCDCAPVLAWGLELQELVARAKLGSSPSSPAMMTSTLIGERMCPCTAALHEACGHTAAGFLTAYTQGVPSDPSARQTC